MTRVNCIPVEELYDQHLLAEYREITRISKLSRPLDDYGTYIMGEGHVKFFYDKGLFLFIRTAELYHECVRRGFNVVRKVYEPHPDGLNNGWSPSIYDEMVNATRLNTKLDSKPDFYRLTK